MTVKRPLPRLDADNRPFWTGGAEGKLNITNAVYTADATPIDPTCACTTCSQFSRAYLRHLFLADELLAYTLASIHNLHLLVNLVANIRASLERGDYVQFRDAWLAEYGSGEREDVPGETA